MTAVVFASSRPRFHLECLVGCGLLRGSHFHSGCLRAGMCVLSVESCLHWRGLQRFFRVLSEEREGAEAQRTTPLERRADRGSDSTFQMADIARRILARGSTSLPVCETANCFLFVSLSLRLFCSFSLRSCPVYFFKFQTENTAFQTQMSSLVNPQFLPCILSSLTLDFSFSNRHIYFLSPFFSPAPTFFLLSTPSKLPFLSCSFLPLQQKAASIWL